MWLSAYRSISPTVSPSGPTTPQQDWINRTSGAQVVWSHSFASAAEANQFRWENTIGNDPLATAADATNLRWSSNGGPGDFGFLSIYRPSGSSDGNTPSWWRPFSPMLSPGNGQASNDPGANGTITRQTWAPTSHGGQTSGWTNGWYSNNAALGPDGVDFWIQIRIKMDTNASIAGAVSPAKLVEINFANPVPGQGATFVNQNLITYLNGSFGGGRNYHRIYSGDGGGIWDYTANAYIPSQSIAMSDSRVVTGSDSGHNEQVGGSTWNPPTGYCNIQNTAPGSTNACWAWSGGWDTVLYHVTPGPVTGNGPHGGILCSIQVYAAHQGETSYTKIRDQTYELNGWEAAGKEGYQSLYFAAYSNNLNQPAGITSSYAQVIFAKGDGTNNIPIPCPQDLTAPAWFTSLSNLTWATPVSNWVGSVIDPLANGENHGNEGQSAVYNDWTGAGLDQTRNTIFMLGNGGHVGYWGNEVYALDFTQPSPAWVRRRNATASQTVGPAQFAGTVNTQNDGRPPSDHTGCDTVSGNGRWIKAGLGGTPYVGNPVENRWYEYSPFSATTPAGTTLSGLADDWISLGNGYSAATGTTTQCSACYDPIKNQIIKVHGGAGAVSVEYVPFPALTVTSTNVNNLVLNEAIAAIDYTNGIILVRAGHGPGQGGNFYVWLNYLGNPTGAWTWIPNASVTGIGTDIPDRQSFWWHPQSHAFITWGRTLGLQKIVPAVTGSGNSRGYSSLTISTVSVSGTAPVFGIANGNPMYNKVQMVNDMGNGQSMLVVIPAYANPDIFVCKIPLGGV